jgi:hypothetical protein
MIMPVTDQQAAALRAQLAGKVDEHKRLFAQLDPVAARKGYGALVSAAFCEAADQRFGKGDTGAEVIEFVGDVRSRSSDAADKIDPRIAERLIRAVYTDEEVGDIDARTKFTTQLLLLAGMVSDQRFDDAGLDEFMARARKLADQWLS